MPSNDHGALVRSLFEDYLNHGRFDQLGDVVADEYTGRGGQRGPAAFAAPISGLRAAFPDLAYSVEDVVAAGDRVAVRWVWRGTFRRAFLGQAPTDRRVETSGLAIFQLTGGKVVRSWLETDRLGFLQAIGAAPADLGAGPPR